MITCRFVWQIQCHCRPSSVVPNTELLSVGLTSQTRLTSYCSTQQLLVVFLSYIRADVIDTKGGPEYTPRLKRREHVSLVSFHNELLRIILLISYCHDRKKSVLSGSVYIFMRGYKMCMIRLRAWCRSVHSTTPRADKTPYTPPPHTPYLLPAATSEQVGLAPDDNHIVPRSRRRRTATSVQLSPLAMTISVPSSLVSVGGLLGDLLHAALHTVHRGVLGAHAGRNQSGCCRGAENRLCLAVVVVPP